MLDAEDHELRLLANRDWQPGFDGALLPGRIQTMRMAGDMRKVLHTAATVLGQSRAELTFAMQKLRKTGNDASERRIIAALDSGIAWLQGQLVVLTEARERMRIADARLELIRRDCPETE